MSHWYDRFKEKEGKKGLIPWLSVKMQKWILIGVVCAGVLTIAISIGSGGFLPTGLLSILITAFTVYIGFKTNWLKNIDQLNKPMKIAGAITIGIGLLTAIVFLAIAVFYVVVIILVIFLMLALLFFFVKEQLGEDKGKIKGRAGEVIGETRIIRRKMFDQGSNFIDENGMKVGAIQKAWFSDDQIIRDEEDREIGRITKNMWNDDVQDICNEDGHKVGEIKTNIMGEREIVDESGDRVGIIDKNIWGETTIRED